MKQAPDMVELCITTFSLNFIKFKGFKIFENYIFLIRVIKFDIDDDTMALLLFCIALASYLAHLE